MLWDLCMCVFDGLVIWWVIPPCSGSLGDISRYAKSFTDLHEVNAYLSFNVSSALSLTAGVLEVFSRRQGLRRCVVNVSSLCALKPFPSWVLYCTGKAARDMMFRVLAEEEPNIRVLSYAPGTFFNYSTTRSTSHQTLNTRNAHSTTHQILNTDVKHTKHQVLSPNAHLM